MANLNKLVLSCQFSKSCYFDNLTSSVSTVNPAIPKNPAISKNLAIPVNPGTLVCKCDHSGLKSELRNAIVSNSMRNDAN